MAVAIKKTQPKDNDFTTPRWHAEAREIQKYGEVIQDMPHRLDAGVRSEMVG